MHEIDLRRIDLNLLVVFEFLMAERSVSRAAERLARTQSAISHALGRLRDQVGDPLLVKEGGQMRPSPFAEHLASELRPILASIRRALVPPRAFDPATTVREFRIAVPDLTHSLFPRLEQRIRREAPSARLEWVARDAQAVLAVADGRIDMALVPSTKAMPEGLSFTAVRPFRWASFVRKSHPGIKSWGRRTWARWPHIGVRVSVGVPSPVERAAARSDLRRTVTTWVPHFSAVAPLLARSELIATLPMVVMYESLERFGLHALKTPLPVPPMTHTLIWSQRLGKDLGLRWFRGHVEALLNEVIEAADAEMPR